MIKIIEYEKLKSCKFLRKKIVQYVKEAHFVKYQKVKM